MRKSFWAPRWWVFLPLLLPLVYFFWFWLGNTLGLDTMPTPEPPPDPGYPAWLENGYYSVLWALLYLFCWAGMVLKTMHDALGGDSGFYPMWFFWLGVGISVAASSLFLYGLLLLARRLRTPPPPFTS